MGYPSMVIVGYPDFRKVVASVEFRIRLRSQLHRWLLSGRLSKVFFTLSNRIAYFDRVASLDIGVTQIASLTQPQPGSKDVHFWLTSCAPKFGM